MKNKSKQLQTAIKAAKEGEKIIRKYYQSDLNINTKEDNTPFTMADKETEEVVREVLASEFPEYGILGEEDGEKDGNEYTWIIDPIDGTKNFIRQIPIFGTEIALMKDDEIILGVSNIPLMGELMYAEKGKGAYINDDKIECSEVKKIKDAFVTHGSLHKFKNSDRYNKLSELMRQSHRERGLGDLYNYHILTSGRCDVVFEIGINIWDVAPMVSIVEEAGGKITELDGSSIDLDTSAVLATGTEELYEEVFDFINN